MGSCSICGTYWEVGEICPNIFMHESIMNIKSLAKKIEEQKEEKQKKQKEKLMKRCLNTTEYCVKIECRCLICALENCGTHEICPTCKVDEKRTTKFNELIYTLLQQLHEVFPHLCIAVHPTIKGMINVIAVSPHYPQTINSDVFNAMMTIAKRFCQVNRLILVEKDQQEHWFGGSAKELGLKHFNGVLIQLSIKEFESECDPFRPSTQIFYNVRWEGKMER